MKKPDTRAHNVIRTAVVAYRFGSGKAAASNQRNKKREPSKLPTSLDELKKKIGDVAFCSCCQKPLPSSRRSIDALTCKGCADAREKR